MRSVENAQKILIFPSISHSNAEKECVKEKKKEKKQTKQNKKQRNKQKKKKNAMNHCILDDQGWDGNKCCCVH